MKNIAIIGNCKNAGKTTVLNYLLSKSKRIAAITSIGLDGEDVDSAFGSDKPRVYVKAGTFIITAKSMLNKCDITYEVKATTTINTQFGYLCIVEALTDGYVMLVGPSKVSEINTINSYLTSYNIDTLYVDGAINRKQFSSLHIIDEVHLVVGAASHYDMQKTLAEVQLLKNYYAIPKIDRVYDKNYNLIVDNKNYYYDYIDLDVIKEVGKIEAEIYINGAINSKMLEYLILLNQEIIVIVDDANKLFLTLKDFQLLAKSKIDLRVLNTINIKQVYTNPVGRGYSYDKEVFKSEVAKVFASEIIDVGGAKREL